MAADARDPAALQHRLGELLAEHRELIARLDRDQRYFQRLARSVWRVQEEERRRLARELHDGIGQNLTVLLRQLERAQDALPDAAAARATLQQARDLTTATLAETRALSRLLRPQMLDDLGLVPALTWLVRTIGESHGLDIRLDIAPDLPALDNELATLVFRVAQEALANAARHAQARRVEVRLAWRSARLSLRIRDDGRGCDPAQAFAAGPEGRGSGLGGIRDRVRLFGGELVVDSAPGGGFVLTIDVPLTDADKESAA